MDTTAHTKVLRSVWDEDKNVGTISSDVPCIEDRPSLKKPGDSKHLCPDHGDHRRG